MSRLVALPAARSSREYRAAGLWGDSHDRRRAPRRRAGAPGPGRRRRAGRRGSPTASWTSAPTCSPPAWPGSGSRPATRCCSRSPTGSRASSPGTACSRPAWCRCARWPRTVATRSARSAGASAPSRTSWRRRGRPGRVRPRAGARASRPCVHVLVLGELGRARRRRRWIPVPRAGRVEAIQAGLDPDGVAAFQLSGGTTGVPKVIPRLHAEYWYNAVELRPLVGLDARHPRRAPDPDHPQRRDRLRRARVAQRRRLPACSAPPTSTSRCRCMARERATHVLLGHGHFRAVGHPGFAAAAAALTQVVLSGTKVPPALFDDLEAPRAVVGAAVRDGRGAVPHHPSRRRRGSARATTVGTPLSALDEIRVLEPGTEDRGARRRDRRAGLPRPVHAARLLRRRRAQRAARSPPTASTAPATSPRSG